jgi:hypothetical protein
MRISCREMGGREKREGKKGKKKKEKGQAM